MSAFHGGGDHMPPKGEQRGAKITAYRRASEGYSYVRATLPADELELEPCLRGFGSFRQPPPHLLASGGGAKSPMPPPSLDRRELTDAARRALQRYNKAKERRGERRLAIA